MSAHNLFTHFQNCKPLPPADVQQRAWETAYVLGDEFRPRVPAGDLWRVDAAFRAGPHSVKWWTVCDMAILYGQTVEARR